MTPIKRILCPTDFSDCSKRAFEHAAAFARRYDAEVTVLHVYLMPPPVAPIPTLDGGSVIIDSAVLADACRQEHEQEMQRFIASMPTAGLRLRPLVVEDATIEAILQHADPSHADIIVMGTHGRSGLERILLGSVAERVLRKSPVPVLAVPPNARQPEASIARILCPVDFSEPSAHALQYAVSLARDAQAHLVVAHVIETVPDADSYQYRFINVPEFHAQVLQAAREQMAAFIAGAAGRAIEQTFVTGKPSRQIVKLAAERPFDLIVMGQHGRTAAERLFFGSTTQHVMREASCPVLSIRQAVSKVPDAEVAPLLAIAGADQ